MKCGEGYEDKDNHHSLKKIQAQKEFELMTSGIAEVMGSNPVQG